MIHHTAFSKSEKFGVPICGEPDWRPEDLSLDADKVECPSCRRICDLGPLVEAPEFVRLEEFARCEWFATCANGTTTARRHPVLGYVPICGRCARAVGLVLP